MLTDHQILRITAAELTDLHGQAEIEAGHHLVQCQLKLRLSGAVEQAPVQLATPTVSIPLDVVLALVAEKLNVKAQKLFDLVVDAAVEARERNDHLSDWLGHTQRALSEAKARLSERLAKVERRGPLRRVLRVEDVEVLAATSAGSGLPILTAPRGKRQGKK